MFWLISGPGMTSALGQYAEQFNLYVVDSDQEDTWTTIDLSGDPYFVPANAVVEVLLYNLDGSNEQYVGVRAVGSSLDRRYFLQESEPFGAFGSDHMSMHVQADASSQIQVYSSSRFLASIYILGYWSSGTYVERFDSFTAGANGSWEDVDLGAYGVGPDHVAEIVMTNDLNSAEREAGVRTNGSALERRFDMREAESGGVDAVAAFVKTDDTINATIEVYAEQDAHIAFYLVGYWSEPPGAYAETYADIGSPSTDDTWEDVDLTAFGAPDDSVVEISLSNEEDAQAASMGVRANGSSVNRLPRLNEAEDGGAEIVRMHVQADATATIEFRHEDVASAYTFRMIGYWDECDTSVEYVVSDLGAIVGSDASQAWHINSSDGVAGFEVDTGGDPDAWYLSYGTFTALGVIGGANAEAQGINDNGMVVGWSDDGSDNHRAYSWTSGGGFVNLGTAGGRTDSEALSVNNSSEIVGTVLDFDRQNEAERQAFLYLPSPGHTLSSGMNLLGTLGGEESVAMDINDAGQVVGGAENASAEWRPYLWADGSMTDLGTLGGETMNLDHRAEAINASGHACGRSYTAGDAKHAFFYDGSMTDLGVLTGGSESWAFGLNDSDVVVGTSDVTGGAFRAFVWDSVNGMRNLNNLIPTGTGWTLIRATDINGNGSIVGFGTNDSAQKRAFLLTPACSVGGGVSLLSAALSTGSGTTDGDGVFSADLFDDGGEALGRVEVHALEPGIKVDYELIDSGTEAAPGQSAGMNLRDGFVNGVAVERTLRVATTALQPGDYVRVSMMVSDTELQALGVVPQEMGLHVLAADAPSGVAQWALAGTPLDAAEPTSRPGDSGYVDPGNGTIEYWAVRHAGGTFAVGRAELVDTPAPMNAPHFCGMGALFAVVMVSLCLTMFRFMRWTRASACTSH